MYIKTRTTCRVCGNIHLTPVVNLGPHYLGGSFVKGDIRPPTRTVPLELVLCDASRDEDACGLLQLRHTIHPSILYKHYWYRSGTNATMKNHLMEIAKRISKLNPHIIMDIGCNDGTFLNNFGLSVTKIGVDPSNAVKAISRYSDIRVINKCFPCDEVNIILADVITSFAMFYDLDYPLEFALQVKHCLSHNGFWIFEVAYLPSMIHNNAFDTICHEHLEYYSLSVIERILDQVGMHVIKAEINDINCGSILCWAANKSSIHVQDPNLDAIRESEFDMRLDDSHTYIDFSKSIERVAASIHDFIKSEFTLGKKIHIYGASTKGNTLIQTCNIAKFISCAADRNPDKWGATTLGTNIPITSEEESRAMRPDYYLVLPWQFRSEFIERERSSWRQDNPKDKPKFIFPLPTFEVISID